MRDARRHVPDRALLCSASKGIENDSLMMMSDVLLEELGHAVQPRLTYLSGPSFAKEVAARMPTTVVVAGTAERETETVQHAFATDMFRTYASSDVTGVEIGGALKNVIAIAAGVVDGLGLGYNTTAALITRGLAEITRLAVAEGGRLETLAGLTGLGDLVLTCTGTYSRNRHVGMELAKGRALADILAGMKMVAEGVKTTEAALELGARRNVELPIAAQMAELFAGRTTPAEAVAALMLRPQRIEVETG
jgi:glycerol-3-phosphate dehydrogenase (NAD(P)+)